MIKMLGSKVAVEKVKTNASDNGKDWIKMPESEEFVGVVRHVAAETHLDLRVGTRVYFGKDYQQIKIKGIDLCVMDDKNVVAIDDQR